MARKDKGNNSASRQPNAPEFEHILAYQQPAHNPYYPDPAATNLLPPPPYSSTSVPVSFATARNPLPMSQMNDISYPRIQPGGASVVIQAPGVPYDYRADRYRRKIQSFNTQTIVVVVMSIVLAVWAFSLYNNRTCIESFVVHKLNKDVEIKISDIRNEHLNVAYAGGFLIIVCLLKSAIGFRGKSHSFYLFIVGLFSFFMCAHNAYLSYLTFYSPCVLNSGEVLSGAAKTIISKFTDHLPTPDKGIFGESNVIALAKDDGNGLAIFIMDVTNAIFYFSIFLSSMSLC
jgi:hypothetical protein